jgi:hypothetical protein
MKFKAKKDHILRCVKLGMELERAYLVAECTEKEIEKLDKDERFKHLVDVQLALAENELLTRHELATKVAAVKGNTAGIQWKLSQINTKWSNKDRGETPFFPNKIQVELVGRSVDTNEDKD